MTSRLAELERRLLKSKSTSPAGIYPRAWSRAIDYAIEQARIVFGEGTDGKSQLGRAEPGGCEQHDPDMQNLRAGAPDAA